MISLMTLGYSSRVPSLPRDHESRQSVDRIHGKSCGLWGFGKAIGHLLVRPLILPKWDFYPDTERHSGAGGNFIDTANVYQGMCTRLQ